MENAVFVKTKQTNELTKECTGRIGFQELGKYFFLYESK